MLVANTHKANGAGDPRAAFVNEAPADFPAVSLFDEMTRGRLTWWPRPGVGWYPVETGMRPYNQAYFDRLRDMAKTELGLSLMRARCAMVERHCRGVVIDVGSGCGAFIDERRKWRRTTYGYDVSPASLEWLESRQLLIDPHLVPFHAATMWDVLEHIADFRLLLANVRDWLFLSLPIFRDAEHVLESKHFRPTEHFWYFTRDGLVSVIQSLGFELIEENDKETKLGRQDIGSFAFRRTI